MEDKEYKMSWSKRVVVITISSILIIISTLIPVAYFSIKDGKGSLLIFIFLFTIALLITTYGYSPKKIVVNKNSIRIIKGIGEIIIPKNTIHSYRKLEKKEMAGTIRRAASGGLFGFFGKFSNPQIGKFNMYATRMYNLVLIKLKDGEQIVLSPDNLTEFFKDNVY